jgi:hypothetical protein
MHNEWISLKALCQPNILITTHTRLIGLPFNRLFTLTPIQTGLMILEAIKTAENSVDAMTKATSKILFYRHMDTIMGRRKPNVVKNALNESNNDHTSHLINKVCNQSKNMGGNRCT